MKSKHVLGNLVWDSVWTTFFGACALIAFAILIAGADQNGFKFFIETPKLALGSMVSTILFGTVAYGFWKKNV